MRKNKLLMLSLLPAICLTGCNKIIYSDQYYGFDTFTRVTLKSEHASDIESIKSIIEHFSKLTDSYLAYSDINNIYTINENGETKTKIEKDLYDVLKLSKELQNETFNMFSPYLFDLNKLYKESLEKGELPQESEVSNLLSKANTTNLILEENGGEYFASLDGEGKLDLGGIAKGYCLDLIYDYIASHELDTYLINMTSSILLGLPSVKNSTTKVWISDLENKYFEAKNCAIATSSINRQKYEIDGVTYSHIVNPNTGSAVSAHTTVILKGNQNENAKLDAYATALMNYSTNEIDSFVTSKNLSALVIDGINIVYSRNMEVK